MTEWRKNGKVDIGNKKIIWATEEKNQVSVLFM
jgi:hypothetical protein